ncbi:hypothetical protein LEP1GSC163_0386 [Leptospira santarosai str. CBC379]|uniref:hypothetical protein n=1 Tax=Leptospira santarosai TaxID=28183 RepID=UPI0002982C02|nr:hypothetical protein [Leptospira santarosai]EKR89871.1 hypothetical protein LEP1GSC163_0386 [Leptospira santarosai str. CBC379]
MNYEQNLDTLSKYLLDRLSQEKPEWLNFLTFKKNEGENSYHIDVDLIFLSKSFEYCILSSENDELSVFMDHYHTHCYGDNDTMYKQAMDFILDIIKEELVTVSASVSGEKWFYSACIKPNGIEKEIDHIFLERANSKIVIQSYQGNFNRVIYGTGEKR